MEKAFCSTHYTGCQPPATSPLVCR